MKKLLSPISLAVLSLCFTTHLAYGMENEDDWGQERSKSQQCRESNLSLYAEGKWGAYHKYFAEKSQLTDEDALFIFSKWEIIKEVFASMYAHNDAIDHTDMPYNRHQHSESHLPSDSFNQFKTRCDDYIEKKDITWGQSEFIFTKIQNIKETLQHIGITVPPPSGAIDSHAHISFLINPPPFAVEILRMLNLSNNCLKDVSFLTPLTNLKILNMKNNSVEDVTPLKHLIKLTNLNMRNNCFKDASPLMSLTNLTDLSISGNPVEGVIDLTPLRNLKFHDLKASSLGDIGTLAPFTLKALELRDESSIS